MQKNKDGMFDNLVSKTKIYLIIIAILFIIICVQFFAIARYERVSEPAPRHSRQHLFRLRMQSNRKKVSMTLNICSVNINIW